MWTIFLVMIVVGAVFAVVGWMALTEKLPRNHIAGIRTRFTLSSDENWYATHRAASPMLIFGGVAVAMVGVAFLPFAIAGKISNGVSVIASFAMAAVVVTVAIASLVYGTRVARRGS